MTATTDWVGIAAVIAAVFSGIAAVIAAIGANRTQSVKQSIDTNGDPRTLGQIATDVGAAVAPHDEATPPTPVE